MKKSGNIAYIIICLLLCLTPFVCMTFAATNTTTENKKMTEMPSIMEEGKWNQYYFQQLGAYFDEHFAFRPALVTADSIIQSKIFGVSNMGTVLVGSNGWLYYTSTLNDYQGKQTLSEKGAWNAAHNISLMQKSVEEKGGTFLLTVAPNKNSLYGENMPYYDKKKIGDVKNMSLFEPQIEKWAIPYADLFREFKKEKETLYLKRDSHWNQKGAVLAYDTMLDFLKIEHETYETVESIRTKEEYGDLNKMIYPLYLYPEWNYSYQNEQQFSYVTDTKSVEEAWIETENDKGTGSLLMFRDSFGNTLLPLMADTFENAYFAKSVPYNLEEYMDSYHPEYVIVEKVERNIDDFAIDPPIVTGIETELKQEIKMADAIADISMKESEYDTNYWEISGNIPEDFPKNTKIYIELTQSEKSAIYEAFTVSNEDTDYGYLLYMNKNRLTTGPVKVRLILEVDGVFQCVKSENFDTTLIGSIDVESAN